MNFSILIIEGSVILRERIAAMLLRVPNVVIAGEADTGMKGLEMALLHRPDAIILSLELPDVSGMDLLPHLRQTRTNCRIIALTDYRFKEVCQRSLESGADFCFDKTTEFEEAVRVCMVLADPLSPPPSGPGDKT